MIGEKIRRRRNELEMSMKLLAEKTGLSSGFISQVERELTEPSITSLRKIAKALGVAVFYFFTEEKNEEFNKVYRILKELSHVDGWTPEKAIYLYHAEDDESVPFECALYAYEEFTKRGATISFFSGTGGHVGYAAQMFISLYLYLILR